MLANHIPRSIADRIFQHPELFRQLAKCNDRQLKAIPCGHAYQAYGAGKEKTGKALYDAQRDKMTCDINKFIKNKSLLLKLFGDVNICKWILLVPRVGLKDLKAHSHKMTKLVRDAQLPYVTDDFYVTYCDEDSFTKERDRILA